MGLYDYVRCEYPLPDLDDPTSLQFQTKDFDDPYMENYTITKEGRLLHEIVRYEDHSDPSAKPGSIESLAGCMTPVPVGTEDMNWHGYLTFYDNREIPSDHKHIFSTDGCWCGMKREESHEWFEYRAKFTDGTLVEVKRERGGK